MSDDDDKDASIYIVDTVPPPAGESDAYNAPTKVGPMAAAVVNEMMHAAEKKAAELSERAKARRADQSAVDGAREKAPPSKPTTGSGDVRPPSAPPQRMYEEDDEDNAATLLSRAARAPVVAPLPHRR